MENPIFGISDYSNVAEKKEGELCDSLVFKQFFLI